MGGLFDWSIAGPALLAGFLVLSTHIPLGRKVLERGIIFIDLAIAQIAAVGVIVADSMGLDQGWQVQLAAVLAALIAAAGLHVTEKMWPDIQEALIGVLFVLAATASILLLSDNPHGGEQLKDLLIGQILWVDYQQLLPIAFISAVLLVVWFGFLNNLPKIVFYLIFAVAITASVQLVGVYLVFASLIIPALATQSMNNSIQASMAWAVGLIGYSVGISLSMWFDYPTGALVVWAMAITAILMNVVVLIRRELR